MNCTRQRRSARFFRTLSRSTLTLDYSSTIRFFVSQSYRSHKRLVRTAYVLSEHITMFRIKFSLVKRRNTFAVCRRRVSSRCGLFAFANERFAIDINIKERRSVALGNHNRNKLNCFVRPFRAADRNCADIFLN